MDAAIRIDGLHMRFGRKQVLRGVDLEVPEGTTTVLLGSNGEGKTTLLNACLGLLAWQEGAIAMLGRCPRTDPAAVQRAVGYVPSVPDAYDWMRIGEWFRFLRAHYPGWDDERADEVFPEGGFP